jgi:catechol 2,3-dioxygenase-like lactoylglutathione lyase family enzyme
VKLSHVGQKSWKPLNVRLPSDTARTKCCGVFVDKVCVNVGGNIFRLAGRKRCKVGPGKILRAKGVGRTGHGRSVVIGTPRDQCYGLTISPSEVTVTISGMNHAVLYVRDAAKHRQFYEDLLGFITVVDGPGPYVFMRAPASQNHHDIAFFSIGDNAGPSEAGERTVGMYHLAWQVETLEELVEMRTRLEAAGALKGQSDHGVNKSLYCLDPDGLEFEVMWLVPPEHWGEEENQAIVRPLDLDADVRRFATLIGNPE